MSRAAGTRGGPTLRGAPNGVANGGIVGTEASSAAGASGTSIGDTTNATYTARGRFCMVLRSGAIVVYHLLEESFVSSSSKQPYYITH